ncbi:APC family permease [Marimonas sp. MJW-29]|uniref:APC family permease n=1 Tax=Sulfitobacter sediminis TaxID=3234186 RepID=A0ABV3RLU4_9RHOB
MSTSPDMPPTLRRAISLPLLVLYGLGVTIGAGIYVLVGATAATAGPYAPSAFIVAALVMLFSAGSFAELSGRVPQSAGEAAYVEAGFRTPFLTLFTGALLLAATIVSSAAITVGSAGYIAVLAPLEPWTIILGVIVLTFGLAAWGIVESVAFAALLTLLEIGGLVVVVAAGLSLDPGMLSSLPEVIPPFSDSAALASVGIASLTAFFAFIGFDSMVNIVEETKDPSRNMPLGILLTLIIATLLYFSVALVAVKTLPLEELGQSTAPISLLFERLTGFSPVVITLIAVGATINGVVIQTVLAARVLYGLGNVGRLPRALARLNPRTRTPVFATVLVSLTTAVFALFFPIDVLAERTTQVVLVVFILINAALLRMKLRGDPAPEDVFTVPLIVPLIGLLSCLAMLVGPLLLAGGYLL